MKNSQKSEDFSQRLRLTRKNRGLSQEDFAKKLGFTGHAQVSRYENGKSLPDAAILEKMSTVLQLDLHWLLTGNPSPGIQAWKESYVEVARLATTYITWDNTHKEEKRTKLLHELIALTEIQSTGKGVSEHRIVSLKQQIAAIDKRLSDNASAQHQILDRVYGKKE